MKILMQIIRDFLGLLGLFTRLPVGDVTGKGGFLKRAAWGLPFVGLLVGGFAALVFLLFQRVGLPSGLSVILGLIAGVFITGALHEDGLADYCDGLGVGGREKILRVMRDSQIGSFGVIGLCFVLLWRVVALYELARLGHGAVAFLIMHMVGRGVLPLLMFLPLADEKGLAHLMLSDGRESGRLGENQAGTDKRGAIHSQHDPTNYSLTQKGAVLGFLIALVIMLVVVGGFYPFGVGFAVVLIAAAAALGTGLIALRRIGGMTGDVYGAAEQVAELAALGVLLSFLKLKIKN